MTSSLRRLGRHRPVVSHRAQRRPRRGRDGV